MRIRSIRPVALCCNRDTLPAGKADGSGSLDSQCSSLCHLRALTDTDLDFTFVLGISFNVAGDDS